MRSQTGVWERGQKSPVPAVDGRLFERIRSEVAQEYELQVTCSVNERIAVWPEFSTRTAMPERRLTTAIMAKTEMMANIKASDARAPTSHQPLNRRRPLDPPHH